MIRFFIGFTTLIFLQASTLTAEITIESNSVHLRITKAPEWSAFDAATDGKELLRKFHSKQNEQPLSLVLRQRDVKQKWEIRLNDKLLGRLVQHEEDLKTTFEIPVGTLKDGENRLSIKQAGNQVSDDIVVGEIAIHQKPVSALLTESTILIDIVDENRQAIPGRITLVNESETLMPVSATQSDLAAREGVVYTSTGKAAFGVMPGQYRVYAGRGFEYSIDQADVSVRTGEQIKRTLTLRRVVNTSGWVACDTHVHTVTHSGHGDCSIAERMVTLAGEGVELPIATDHNKQIDYRPTSKKMSTEKFFTPVVGNEVTTKFGHFNVFPAQAGGPKPNHNLIDWQKLFANIYQTPDVKVAILNHARDIHSEFRPFSPRHHVSISGEDLDDRDYKFNAVEILNSGATQTDATELFRDWCGLVNRGIKVTPIGCSDSHDVSRYIVGQGRTYIRCDDSDPSAIDIDQALQSLVSGRVIVSYGLMADVSLRGQSKDENQTTHDKAKTQFAGPGETTAMNGDLIVNATIRGPQWCNVEYVQLYVNGRPKVRVLAHKKEEMPDSGVRFMYEFALDRERLRHDAWITVVAVGKGIDSPHWRTAKPYQPDSPDFTSSTFSCSGPIRIDVDGDGVFSSANEYAQQIVSRYANDSDDQKLTKAIVAHDAAVAIQVFSLLSRGGVEIWQRQYSDLIASLPAEQRDAINQYRFSRRASENARLEAIE